MSGSCLSFDGYTNKVTLAADQVHRITGDFAIEAWIAPQEYPWNLAGIVDHSQEMKAGYTLSINYLGQICLFALIEGSWVGLLQKRD